MPNLRIKIQQQRIEGQVEQLSGPGCESLVQALLERLQARDCQVQRRAEYYEQTQRQDQDLTQSQ